MESVEEFLAHAIQLEREAADRFGQLADAMQSAGNLEVGKLFRRLAEYSRMHLADAQERAGFRDVPRKAPDEFQWPDSESPESAAIWTADPLISQEEALLAALDAEMAGLDYYQQVCENSRDPEILALAKEFVEEEEEHVRELNRWIKGGKKQVANAGNDGGQGLPEG